MDENDILNELKELVERSSVFSQALVEWTDGEGFVIDDPTTGRYVVTVKEEADGS